MSALADVYAGDLDKSGEATAARTGRFLFRILADATPDGMPRVANQFILANTAPLRAKFQLNGAEQLSVEVVVDGITAAVADRIARKLDQQCVVINVSVEVEA